MTVGDLRKLISGLNDNLEVFTRGDFYRDHPPKSGVYYIGQAMGNATWQSTPDKEPSFFKKSFFLNIGGCGGWC